MPKTKLQIIYILAFFLVLFSCNKEDKLKENANPYAVNFILTQPSISTATFVAKCTNYDVILDSVIFLSPNSAIYYQFFNAQELSKNEEFLTGGWESADGLWVITFRGQLQDSSKRFSSSIPYDMKIDEDEE